MNLVVFLLAALFVAASIQDCRSCFNLFLSSSCLLDLVSAVSLVWHLLLGMFHFPDGILVLMTLLQVPLGFAVAANNRIWLVVR